MERTGPSRPAVPAGGLAASGEAAALREEAEVALHESEEQFRRLILSLPAAVYTTDREGRVTLFNERAAELWGRRPEIGKDRWCGSWRIYLPDGTPIAHEACPMAVALREERRVRGQEIVVERPDGTRAHVVPYPEPLRDASGAVVGAVNMLVDVTELKRADRDRAWLAAIVESSDDAIISKTLDGILTSWNAGAERILGYTADEAVGQPVLILIPPDRQDEEDLILGRARRGERIEHFETIRLAKGGRALDVSLTVSPVRASDGRIIGASKILRDITASKRAEAALRESESRFRHLAEALPAIAYTSTGEGQPDYVNARWAEYTGLSTQVDYLEDPSAAIHPDDREHVAAMWARAKAAGEPMEVELRLRRHDGAYRWFLTRVVPVLDADGRVVRWFGTSTDIHNQKAAEAELAERVAERTAELARSNEELDQFAYVASHDLKAPLRAIENLAAWIAADAGPLLPEESKRHLGLLQGRVRRMEQLLSDLLAYSRVDREEGTPEEVDAAALVREVAELIDGAPGIEVVIGEMPTLVTPRAPLEMVFRNLIGNAFKHHDRPEEGRVIVRAHDADSFVTFTVEDDGPGIPARYHERIFGLFQTLRPRDEVEGSGMGLAVVKKAVESRGGTVRVDSAEGRGTTFAFTWPKHV